MVFKRELLFFPGLGTCMWLSRYLSVDRRDRESGKALMRDAEAALRRGKDIMWFPEGTRATADVSGPLGAFKPGAFKVAVESGAAVVPISISGARALMPHGGGLPQLFSGSVRIRVGAPISSAGKTVDELSAECRAAIEAGLRDCDVLTGRAAKTPAAASSAAAAGEKEG